MILTVKKNKNRIEKNVNKPKRRSIKWTKKGRLTKKRVNTNYQS